MDILLKNIHVVSPLDLLDEETDIFIKDGVISKIGNSKRAYKNVTEINCKGKTAVPGLFDMHVHFREPGQTYKEDLVSGCEAAANGGFTGVLCMPNTKPEIDSPMIVRDIKNKISFNIVDVEIAASATMKSEGEIISPILSLNEAGALAFTDDGLPVSNPEILRRVLEYTSQIDSVVIQHCEDKRLSDKGVMHEGFVSTVTGLKGIPETSETIVISRDLLLTEYINNSRYHVQHISCGKSVELVRKAKEEKINVTCEVCPHHFVLTDVSCLDYDTNFKMNPPLRTSDDIEKILSGLSDGTIDVICTDHAPHAIFEKEQNFNDAPFGIIGLETAVGLSYTFLVKKNVISFEDLIYKMSVNPRRILKLEDIRIKTGESANITLLDLNAKWRVNKNKFKSKSRNTPFDGYELQCKPYCVINKNQIYYSKL